MKKNTVYSRVSAQKSKSGAPKNEKSKTSGDKPKTMKSNQEFPGYPQYPPKDDIMNPKNGIARNELSETSGKLFTQASQTPPKEFQEAIRKNHPLAAEGDDVERTTPADSDVTAEELKLIGSDELNSDMGEDDELKKRTWEVDMVGEDLDIPGPEPDVENENIADDDEENNLFSLGGDRHDDLDEDKDLGR